MSALMAYMCITQLGHVEKDASYVPLRVASLYLRLLFLQLRRPVPKVLPDEARQRQPSATLDPAPFGVCLLIDPVQDDLRQLSSLVGRELETRFTTNQQVKPVIPDNLRIRIRPMYVINVSVIRPSHESFHSAQILHVVERRG